MTPQPVVAAVRPWTPPSVANFNALHPGWAHRFCDTRPDRPGGERLPKLLQQGWVIAEYGNDGMRLNRPTGASSLDGSVTYKGLVLLKMPIEMAKARNDYWRDRGNRRVQAAQAVANARAASRKINDQHAGGANLTSAFGRSMIRHPDGRVEVSDTEDRRSSGDPEHVLRDIRPEDVRALEEGERKELEQLRQEKAARLQAEKETAERSARPRGSRNRSRSFPSTHS